MTTCHDCGVKEGQIHEWGCDMERCPFCGHQLISCRCPEEVFGLKMSENDCACPDIPDPKDAKTFRKAIEKLGRVPYIQWPNLCARCGNLWPDMFLVDNKEWKHYIEIGERDKMLCRPCYDEIKRLIDGGKK